MTSGAWTNVDDLVAVLSKRWEGGRYALAYAGGVPWTPVALPVRAPTAAELLDRFDDARRWAERFERETRRRDGSVRFRIEGRTIKGRNLGANEVPARIWIDTLEQLCALLGTAGELRALDAIIDQTDRKVPALSAWVRAHPSLAVRHREIWGEVLRTVAWIAAHDTRRMYLRQIDVDGVDTKFVERNRSLLDDLLTSVLPPERVDRAHGASDFTRRFGFRPKPGYTRFRLLSPLPGWPAGITELRLRTEELASLDVTAQNVFVVENEVTYLAFPDVPDAIVIFGSGFGLTLLEDLPWMAHKRIVYWGDIDTHGFDILSRLRGRFADVESILMDLDTLLTHPRQWVVEPIPTNRPLPHLTGPEAALYHDLIEDRFGEHVRLEQERVRFSRVQGALEPWTGRQASADTDRRLEESGQQTADVRRGQGT